MGLFSIKKKYTAGVFIDGDKFQCLIVKHVSGKISVVEHISDTFNIDVFAKEDSLVNTREKIDSCFSILSKNIIDKETPINISLPISDSLLRVVSMPGMSIAEAKLAFRYEFENYFPFSLKEGIFDITEINFPLINKDSEKRFIVVAARLSLIDKIMSAAAYNGLIVASIEPAQISIERAMTSVTHLDDAIVYIYAGRFRSVMILSWKGNGVFYRSILLGVNMIPFEKDSLNEELQTQTTALVKEIRFSLQFALSQIRGFNPQSVYLSGPGVNEVMLSMLKEALSIEDTSIIDCFDLHQVEKKETSENWDIPLGSVMR